MSRTNPEPSPEFLEFLNDPGIQVRHPLKKGVSLRDIFVFPDLAPPGGGAVSSSILTGPDWLGRAALVTGPEDSGKTTLLKALAERLLAGGFYPVYLDGRSLASPDTADIIDAAGAAITAQYTPESAQTASGEGASGRILLVDNIESSGGGGANPRELASAGLGEFASVILTSGDEYHAADALGGPHAVSVFSLAEFGHERRDELIGKWVSMGAGGEGGVERAEKARGMVDTVLGRNLVPSYPVFILTILQIADSDDPGLPGGSSYGHYYEYMITKPLKSGLVRNEYGLYINILSRLAYSMLKSGSRSTDRRSLVSIITEQAAAAGIPIGADEAAASLLGTETLRERDGSFEFRHGYIYHYFAALHISRSLGSAEIREETERLFAGLGEGDNASVALFLTYLSDDPFVTGQLEKSVERAVPADGPHAEEDPGAFLDELLSELEKLAEKDRKLREARAEYLVRERAAPPVSPAGGRDAIYPDGRDALLGILRQALAVRGGAGLSGAARRLWLSILRQRLLAVEGSSAQTGAGRGPSSGAFYDTLLRISEIYIDACARGLRGLSLLYAGSQDLQIHGPLYRLGAGLLRADPPPDTDETGKFLEENPGNKSARAILARCASEGSRLFRREESVSKGLCRIIEYGPKQGNRAPQ